MYETNITYAIYLKAQYTWNVSISYILDNIKPYTHTEWNELKTESVCMSAECVYECV